MSYEMIKFPDSLVLKNLKQASYDYIFSLFSLMSKELLFYAKNCK